MAPMLSTTLTTRNHGHCTSTRSSLAWMQCSSSGHPTAAQPALDPRPTYRSLGLNSCSVSRLSHTHTAIIIPPWAGQRAAPWQRLAGPSQLLQVLCKCRRPDFG
ncbi:hypothetical protein N657DRAFT_42960 [Parathielavia appendiculata]|uniref:Uncharacterized protein n=1 Tax=Parathielavia appendiculata TaxID=2587402 RepID=A0AAN6Z8G0_9PEZI|nr:hypothetical protein N657DRAFT_42960 [Parathielavia appendiculata]